MVPVHIDLPHHLGALRRVEDVHYLERVVAPRAPVDATLAAPEPYRGSGEEFGRELRARAAALGSAVDRVYGAVAALDRQGVCGSSPALGEAEAELLIDAYHRTCTL